MNKNVLKIGVVALFVAFGISTQSCEKKATEPAQIEEDTVAQVTMDTVAPNGDSVKVTETIVAPTPESVKAVEEEKIEEVKK